MGDAKQTPAALAAAAVGVRSLAPTAGFSREAALSSVAVERTRLEIARTPEDAEEVRARAEAMRAYLRAKDPELAHDVLIEANALAVDAERRIGQLLPKPTQGKPNEELLPRWKKLAPSTVSRYRALAEIPDRLWSTAIARARAERVEVSGSGMLRLLGPAPDPKPEPPPPPAAPSTGAPEPLPPAPAPRRKEATPPAVRPASQAAQVLAAMEAARALAARFDLDDGQSAPATNHAGRALPSVFGRAWAQARPMQEGAIAVFAAIVADEAEDVALGVRVEPSPRARGAREGA